jgi:hypothetical protein
MQVDYQCVDEEDLDEAIECNEPQEPAVCQADTSEPNNDAASATPLTVPAAIEATYCGDVDYYGLTLCPDSSYQARINFEHDDADLELDVEVNGVTQGRSESVNDFEVLNLRVGGSNTVDVELLVRRFRGGDVPYNLTVVQTAGIDCFADVPTTTIETTAEPTTTESTTVDLTAAPTCSCTGPVRATRSTARTYNIRFRTSCNRGHRIQFCLERIDSRSGSPAITATLQRQVSGNYASYQAAQVLGESEGDRLCYTADIPSNHAVRNARFRLLVDNNVDRRRFSVQYETPVIRSCVPV